MHHTPYMYIHYGGTISNGGSLVAQYQILRPSPSATATQYFRLISLQHPANHMIGNLANNIREKANVCF